MQLQLRYILIGCAPPQDAHLAKVQIPHAFIGTTSCFSAKLGLAGLDRARFLKIHERSCDRRAELAS